MFHVAGKRIPIGHKIQYYKMTLILCLKVKNVFWAKNLSKHHPYNHKLGTYAFVGICQPTLR